MSFWLSYWDFIGRVMDIPTGSAWRWRDPPYYRGVDPRKLNRTPYP
jgi:hypothetical protein